VSEQVAKRQASGVTPSPGRVSSEAARFFRQVAAVLLAMWFGGILVLGVGIPGTFGSVDGVLKAPPPEFKTTLETAGPANTRALLRYQVAEANGRLFETWAWVQSGLAVAILLVLLFATDCGKPSLLAAAGLAVLALLMQWMVIPRMRETSREAVTAAGQAASDAAGRFVLLHRGFGAFEAVVVLLGLFLLARLLRRGRGGRGRAG
jgi:hypothetical protein